jgi:hypothetical protein
VVMLGDQPFVGGSKGCGRHLRWEAAQSRPILARDLAAARGGVGRR